MVLLSDECQHRGNHREKENLPNDYIDYGRERNRSHDGRRVAKSQQEGPCCRKTRARWAEEDQGGQEGQPGQASAQGRQKGRRRPRRQQGGEDPRPAETGGRGNSEGTDESYRVAGPFGSWLSLGY